MKPNLPGTENVEPTNWPKRRRAMIAMLNNPFIPKSSQKYLRATAEKLIIKLENNNHPQCAHLIREQLTKVKPHARRFR